MFLIVLLLVVGIFYAEFLALLSVYEILANRMDGLASVLLIMLYFLLTIKVGSKLIRYQSGALLSNIKTGIHQEKRAIRAPMLFLAGLLFMIPGFVSDFLALLCLFPPTSWLMAIIFNIGFKKVIKNGQVRFYSTFGQASAGWRKNTEMSDFSKISDPTIIDVEARETSKEIR